MGFNYLCFSAYDSDGMVVDGSIPYVTSSGTLGGCYLGIYAHPQYWMIPVSWNGTKCNLINMSMVSSCFCNKTCITEITSSASYSREWYISAPDTTPSTYTCVCLYTCIGATCIIHSWPVTTIGLLRLTHCAGTDQACLKWYAPTGSFEGNWRMSATPTSGITNVCLGICGHGNSGVGIAIEIPSNAFILRDLT